MKHTTHFNFLKMPAQTSETLMFSVILAPNYVLTPFDLRGQTFMVNVDLSTHYHGHIQKTIFRAERLLLDTYK